MMVKNNYYYLKIATALGLAGFISHSLYKTENYFSGFPLLITLLVTLYITQFFLLRILKENNLLFNLTVFLIVIGFLILLKVNPQLATRQLLWIIMGCFICLISLTFLKYFSHDFVLKAKFKWLFLTIFLLSTPLIWGIEVSGATSWLEIWGLRFQPAEAAKLSFSVFLASWFKDNQEKRNLAGWPVWVSTFLCLALLVLQRDLGTGLVFYLVFLVFLYVSSGKLKGPILGLIFLVFGGLWAYYYFPHVENRILAWLNPWSEPHRGGYQIIRSLFALANGGIFGVGLGGGLPQMIPEAHTDFIFSALGEQLGLLGSTGAILIYIFFLHFSLQRAQSIPTIGSRLLAVGLTSLIIIQTLIIMGGVSKLIPLTGLPLPFMSYGGSAIVSNFVLLSIILWLERGQGAVELTHKIRIIKLKKLLFFLFLILVINLSFWQVIKAQDLKENPENPRWGLIEKLTARGTIYDSQGGILAGSSSNSTERYYPLKDSAAHLVGYISAIYGKAGLENTLEHYLLAIPDLKSGILPVNRQGWNVHTTINPRLQQLAGELLQNKKGAIVVLEVDTGNILALASGPSFNPNELTKYWNELQDNETGVFVNRATQGLYPPGSVFKILTGTVLLQLKPEVLKDKTHLPQEILVEGYKIKDMVYRPFLSFQEALGYSSNVFFIKHFLDFNWEEINLALEKSFQINNDFSTLGLSVAQASLGQVIDQPDFAATVIGQGEVLVTPLHMAVWAGAIANGGTMLKPRIVDKIVSSDDVVIMKTGLEVMAQVCSQDITQEILKGLAFTVEQGTGTRVQIPGVKVGGKTGSAENIQGPPHGWFVGIAPLDKPKYVVVVIIENGGSGGDSAAPVARRLLEAALE